MMNFTTPVPENISANSTGPSEGKEWPLVFQVIVSSILIVSALLSVVGNAMVILVVVRHRGMRTRTNLFLVNLAVADFLVGCLAMPAAITTIIAQTWKFGEEFCVIHGFINPFCLVASIHTLMYISIHKCYSITRPFSSSFSLRCVLLMMACTWIWAGFSGTITVVGLNSVTYKKGTSQCGPKYPHDEPTYAHHAIFLITNFVVPLLILVYCYLKMFKVIRAHTKRLQENTTLEQDVILAQQKKVAVTLFIVLACYITCWIPYNIYTIYVTSLKDKNNFSIYINPLAYMFGYLNSACNPIIYAFRSPSFREGYKEILCQNPQYVITDGGHSRKFGDCSTMGLQSKVLEPDTLHDDGGMMSFRRLSNLFSTRRSTGRSPSSPDPEFMYHSTSSLNSQIKKNPRANFKREKSVTELMRNASKHGNGTSIIRQDGTSVIMKEGKIVSVRQKNEMPRNSPLLQGRALFKFRETTGGTTNKVGNGSTVELAPLITNGRLSSHENKMEDNNSCGSDEVFDKGNEMMRENTQETNICDEIEGESDANENNKLIASPVHETENAENMTAIVEEEVKIVISISDDDGILNSMPLTPNTKHRLTRSDLFLDVDKSDNDDNPKAKKRLKCVRSSEVLSKAPLLRFPSVEHLDIPEGYATIC
ncbi:neuropeptide FF receptor 2-like [Haliotis rubra]|uniref:neuropeptide FF receptor 2-like n=1 Tax=Haliotis rubra TaxID=36100 RepID=UPI001EE52AF6|nr:neuropeptide FF receptor 2-like [Haliotis rubra]XP_046543666.1 neuropeptide FF receptor 2-like [Haliotis rubra]